MLVLAKPLVKWWLSQKVQMHFAIEAEGSSKIWVMSMTIPTEKRQLNVNFIAIKFQCLFHKLL